tara:strand:- start:148 stop:438 length:291 start_codon:yes stop_codon:yes gene_type:complete
LVTKAGNPGASLGDVFNIKKRMPNADTPLVVTKAGPGAQVFLRVGLPVTDEPGFNRTRRKARNIVDILAKDGMTRQGIDDLLAALVYEVVDQEYYG